MKKIFSIISAMLTLLSLSSCEDWLQATSSTQFQADQIFESRDGYLDALTGVYLTMGSENTYGKNATWMFPDLMIYSYDSFTSKWLQSWQSHDYSYVDVRSDIETIWRGEYNIIANVNMILNRIEADKDMFLGELEYNLVLGELLALRAYAHFDLMRLFGVSDWKNNESKLTVPYVITYGMETTGQMTYKETSQLLLNDIKKALELLANDPVTGVVPDGFNQGANADGYWNKRQRHLNLYAVEGLAARVYSWMKDYATAAEYAQKALDGAFGSSFVDWINIEELVTTYKDEEKDWTFSTEHLFALEITGLSNRTMGYLIPGSGTSEGFHLDKYDTDMLFNSYYHVDEESGGISWFLTNMGSEEAYEDIRGEALLMKYNQNAYDCYKLYGTSASLTKYRNIMPMIKISEMYYIIAENFARQGRNEEAYTALDAVRHNRGIQDNLSRLDAPLGELAKDVVKEFYNEGQMLFWYRHLAFSDQSNCFNYLYAHTLNLAGSLRPSESLFILPYPDSETSYGRKQEL